MPVDSDFFDGINEAQWAWYNIQLFLDKKEKFEIFRDIAEYNAMFWNPDGVRQVRDSRENSFKVSDEDFKEIVKNISGRDIDMAKNSNSATVNEEMINKMFKKKEMDPYLDMDLDEVKFTPYTEE